MGPDNKNGPEDKVGPKNKVGPRRRGVRGIKCYHREIVKLYRANELWGNKQNKV